MDWCYFFLIFVCCVFVVFVEKCILVEVGVVLNVIYVVIS